MQLPAARAGGHEEGEVPGHDLAPHADGLPEDDAQAVALKAHGVEHGGGASLGEDGPGEVPEVLIGPGDVHDGGLPDGLAVVHGLDGCQLLGVFLDDVGDLVEQSGPIVGGPVSPGGEGGPGGLHGGVYVVLGGLCALGQLFAGGGVGGDEGLAVGGGNPLPVDVKVILFFQLYFHDFTPFKKWAGPGRCSVSRG